MSIRKSKKPNISHILGIDYGKSKVGLAIGDSETRIAFQYGTLENNKNLLQKLAEIVEKENISKVIIGITNLETRFPSAVEIKPLRLNADGLLEKLGSFLKNKLKVDVEYQDEMFTTREAQRNLIEKGVKGIKKYDDQEAARIILQSWLDKHK